MRRMYMPPPLKTRVLLRNPSTRPDGGEDDFGRPLAAGELTWPGIESRITWPPAGQIEWPGLSRSSWGTYVKSHRRDRYPETILEEALTVRAQITVWTIRYRQGLDPNVEIVHGNQVYQSIGPPVLRGGTGSGRRTKYFEVHTELRA